MVEESEVQNKVESTDELANLKKENEYLRTENEDLKRNISDVGYEIRAHNLKEGRLIREKEIEEYKRLKNKYIKLLGISRTLWSYAFDEIIPIGELIPGKQHLDLFNMK